MSDFIDEDLIRRHDPARDLKMGPSGDTVGAKGEQGDDDVRVHAVPNFNITRLAKHKEQVEDQVATAMKELERLRQRQENLEQQKQDLQDLRRKQTDYSAGKQDITDRLNQSLISIEKEELKVEQMLDLLGVTRKDFKARLNDIEALNEEQWAEDEFREELGKALALIDDTRSEFNKAIAKLDALRGVAIASGTPGPAVAPVSPGGAPGARSFGDWFKLGLAVSLPLVLVLVVLGLLQMIISLGWI